MKRDSPNTKLQKETFKRDCCSMKRDLQNRLEKRCSEQTTGL